MWNGQNIILVPVAPERMSQRPENNENNLKNSVDIST